MKTAKPATIRDVALRAKVSAATVSNVLGGKGKASVEVEKRVRRTAKELGYKTDRAASSLRSGKSRIVAVIVPSLENPFFTSLIAAIERCVSADGYEVIVTSSNNSEEIEAARLSALLPWRPSGAVIVPCTDEFATRTLLEEAGTPFVVVDRTEGAGSADAITVDNEEVSATAADHLLALGHRNILVVASSLDLANVRERCAGVRRRVQANGSAHLEILEVGVAFETVTERFERWIGANGLPDAIFVLTNFATLGVLAACSHLSIAFPDDVSLIGFDDYAWMRVSTPSVTAVRQPVDSMGFHAWECLKTRIAGGDGPPVRIKLPCKLEVRQSAQHRFARTGHNKSAGRTKSEAV